MAKNGVKTGGGSRKGRPNKINVFTRQQLLDYIEKKGEKANPFMVLVKLMVDSKDERLKAQCASVLADRILPKLKQHEHELGDKTRKAIRHLYGRSD